MTSPRIHKVLCWAMTTTALATWGTTSHACGGMMVESLNDRSASADQAYVYYTPPKAEGKASAVPQAALDAAATSVSRYFGVCFEDYLRRKPKTMASADFKIEVDKRGFVTRARMTSKARDAGDESFVACLKAAALDLTIDAGAKGLPSAFAFTSSFVFFPPAPDADENVIEVK